MKVYSIYPLDIDVYFGVAFSLLVSLYVQFEGMVYQQIIGIPVCTNCPPLIVDWFLSCYDRDFMSNPHKSKQYDLIDMFSNTFLSIS